MPERIGSIISSDAGMRLLTPIFSWGQACTQSRQKVQSMLPTLRGRYSASSQPRCKITRPDALVPAEFVERARSVLAGTSRRPRMQSLVAQRSQTAGSRTCTSRGERVEAIKLNCPMGQTNLQKEACLKSPSTTNTAAKYANASDAVHQGEDHKSNSSYVNKIATKNATDIHLLRSHTGQS